MAYQGPPGSGSYDDDHRAHDLPQNRNVCIQVFTAQVEADMIASNTISLRIMETVQRTRPRVRSSTRTMAIMAPSLALSTTRILEPLPHLSAQSLVIPYLNRILGTSMADLLLTTGSSIIIPPRAIL